MKALLCGMENMFQMISNWIYVILYLLEIKCIHHKYVWKLKVLVPIHSLIPPNFSNMAIWVPEVESYLDSFVCEVSCKNFVYYRKNKWKAWSFL